MIDKNRELTSLITLVNGKLHFRGSVENNEPVSIDYIAPLGDDLGYTSLELLLLSLSSCLGSAVLVFLRRMNKTISGFEMKARGIRRQAHPTGFESVILDIAINSPDVTDADMHQVIGLAEEKYCPVWSMVKGNTLIETRFTIKS